jgi:hypothetical protein
MGHSRNTPEPCLGLPLDPRGVLAAGVKLGPLRVDPARGLVRAGLQLIQPGGAPVVSGARSGSFEARRFQLRCLRAASLALARPGSPVRAPIQARMTAIEAELAERAAVLPGLLGSPRARPPDGGHAG